MTLFNIYDKKSGDKIDERLTWEEFITLYGWQPHYQVVSWDE